MQRLARVRERCEAYRADAVLLTYPADIRWASGFTGSTSVLLVRRHDAHLVTDGRYAAQAKEEVGTCTIHVPGHDLVGHVARTGLLSTETVLVQSDRLTVAELARFKKHLPDVRWIEATDVLSFDRAVKSDVEVEMIRRAQDTATRVFNTVLARIRPGVTELDLAAEIVYEMMRAGATRPAFEPIVASGPRSALPHARPTSRELRVGDLVLIDFGCMVDGYASDMTRVVSLGRPTVEVEKVYGIVREALRLAVHAARGGIKSEFLDAAARDFIAESGFGSAFSHSLGHGIGLEVHEWPAVSHRWDYLLPAGSTITIEPGIYLDGKFGVRLEDVVRLGEDGCEVLTGPTHELYVL